MIGHDEDTWFFKLVGKVNVIARKQPDGSMEIRREPLLEMPAELKQIIEEMK